MDAAFSFLISVGITLPLAFGLSLARSPLARLWLGRSWGYLPSLWVRSAFSKQLTMSKSRSCPGPRTLNMGDAADWVRGDLEL
jgi:hypothetical protein